LIYLKLHSGFQLIGEAHLSKSVSRHSQFGFFQFLLFFREPLIRGIESQILCVHIHSVQVYIMSYYIREYLKVQHCL